MVFMYDNTEYELATSLRVAYLLQGKFNHKPYMQIFEDIQKMKLEEQISILYIAFNLKNPNICTDKQFLNYVLDTMGLSTVTKKVAELVEAITFAGMTPEEIAQTKNELAIQNAQK